MLGIDGWVLRLISLAVDAHVPAHTLKPLCDAHSQTSPIYISTETQPKHGYFTDNDREVLIAPQILIIAFVYRSLSKRRH